MKIKSKCNKNIEIDDEDYTSLKDFVWHIHDDGEPIANVKINGLTYKIKMKSIIKNVARTSKDVYYTDGNPLNNTKGNLSFTKSTFILYKDYAEMISQCRKYIVKVDLGMVGFLSLCNWTYRDVGYVYTKIDNEYIILHRFLMSIGQYANDKRIVVDHINGDTTDNRLDNLRVCLEKENNINKRKMNVKNSTSEYKGLSWSNKGGFWRVRVMLDKENKYYGEFIDEVAGANAYNYYAKIYHKDYAKINEVDYMDKEEFEKFIRSTIKRT